jgi:hypothetical protein
MILRFKYIFNHIILIEMQEITNHKMINIILKCILYIQK